MDSFIFYLGVLGVRAVVGVALAVVVVALAVVAVLVCRARGCLPPDEHENSFNQKQ